MPAPQRPSPAIPAKVLCPPPFHTLSGSDFSPLHLARQSGIALCMDLLLYFLCLPECQPHERKVLIGFGFHRVLSPKTVPGPSQVFTKYLLNGQKNNPTRFSQQPRAPVW